MRLRKGAMMAAGMLVLVLGISLFGGKCSLSENKKAGRDVNYIAEYGWLRVEGSRLVKQDGSPVQLRGLSSHGINWYPEFLSKESIQSTKAAGANIFRVAMYTDEGKGYIQEPERNTELMIQGIDNSLSLGMYVICDWHVLKDRTPQKHKAEAKVFFEEISRKYKDEPGVIYEIANEPNGGTGWEEIKSYAEEIIPIIRKNSPKALIIVGTPDHCANLDGISENRLQDSNVMYAMHKYFDLTKYKSRESAYLEKLLKRGLPVFVSEWGVEYGELDDTRIKSSKDSRLNFKAAQEYARFLSENQISWCYWSLSNKAEAHSVILADSEKKSDWSMQDMTPSGKFVFQLLKEK